MFLAARTHQQFVLHGKSVLKRSSNKSSLYADQLLDVSVWQFVFNSLFNSLCYAKPLWTFSHPMGIFIHFSSIISWGSIFKLHYLENYSFLEKKKSTQSQFKFHGYIQRLGNMSHCFGFAKYNRCWRDTETTPITVGNGSAGDHRPSLSHQLCPLHFLIAWNGTSDPFRLHR